jgi:hypothetical protein
MMYETDLVGVNSTAPLRPTSGCAPGTDERHTSVVARHMPATARALLGRNAECAVLDRVLDGVRAGRGCVLVMRGEPGVGTVSVASVADAGDRREGTA